MTGWLMQPATGTPVLGRAWGEQFVRNNTLMQMDILLASVLIALAVGAAILCVVFCLIRRQKYGQNSKTPPFALPEPAFPDQKTEWTFYRRDMTEDNFIQQINGWFEANLHLRLSHCSFELGLGEGPFARRSYLNKVRIVYTWEPGIPARVYGLAALSRMGMPEQDSRAMVAQWEARYPWVEVLHTRGSIHQRGAMRSYGLGANDRTQVYLLYTYRMDPDMSCVRPEGAL